MDSDALEERIESLEVDVEQLIRTVESLEAAAENAITEDQLKQAKSDVK